jgi:hypothetical protein
MKNLTFWMELNTPMKILAFCISSFQSSWYFAFCIPWRTKQSLKCRREYFNFTHIFPSCIGCVIPHVMQNVKCQLIWNDEMQNAKIFMGVFSSIQNTKFFMGWGLFGFLAFFFASRGQNPKWRMDTFLSKFLYGI